MIDEYEYPDGAIIDFLDLIGLWSTRTMDDPRPQ
jgi:hypothetical protein